MNDLVNSLINDISPVYSLTKWIFQFNDFDLSDLCSNTTWYIIKTWNELSLDNVILEEYVSEIIDWGTIIDKRYWNKWVSFNLFIQASSYSDLISKIQDLKKNLNWKNWNLYITRAWVVYTYTATCNNVKIPDFNTNQDFIDDIQLDFIITSPNWQIDEPVVTQVTKTTDFEKIINNEWNYKSYWKVILIWKVWCLITDINIELKKIWEVSWESLFINNILNEWDVIIVDYLNKTVSYNWVEIPFTWFMVPLETWNNVFYFTFIGTINIDCVILYNKIYL